MGFVGVQGQFSVTLDVGGQVGQLGGSGIVGNEFDAVKGCQGLGVFLALQNGDAALVISKVAGFAQPLDVYSMAAILLSSLELALMP